MSNSIAKNIHSNSYSGVQSNCIIIGSGFAGLSAACFMAKAGWQVKVLEKQATPGGRARQLIADGFTFDMGPSWYWMPDVFERFFNQFGKKVNDYYTLHRLNPSYKVYFAGDAINLPAEWNELKQLFDNIEENGGHKLEKFIKEAAYKYNVGINNLVFKPSQSIAEFLDWDVLKGIVKLDVFTTMKSHVAKHFSNTKLKQLLEFPVLFLGALPQNIPALYSLMNYADLVGGTWYPHKGMYSIVEAMYQLAKELGVEFYFNCNVEKIVVENNKAVDVTGTINGNQFSAVDTFKNRSSKLAIISNADYHFTETKLLPLQYQTYSKKYWEQRVMSPSCLLYYVGINKKLKNITHHSLFFDSDFEKHGNEIYVSKQYPTNPLFYVCCPSVTDETVAPKGFENLFFLIPIAAGLENDSEKLRKKYFDAIVKRFEERIGESITNSIIFFQSYATSNFIADYNSFKGNAYGLANTLLQTSILKPNCRSKKVSNLFYTGQLTVPGPGVPPSLISGEVVANLINLHV